MTNNELLQKIKTAKNGGYDMCKAIHNTIDEGKEQGIIIGNNQFTFFFKQMEYPLFF